MSDGREEAEMMTKTKNEMEGEGRVGRKER